MSSSTIDSGLPRWELALLPVDDDGDGHEPPADCDDQNENIHPEATEVPYNGVDEDCDGEDLRDVDGDGWDAELVGGEDCADANAAIHPDAVEICDDGRDNNCDGRVDEACGSVDPANPGGMAWTCAQAPASATLVLGLLAVAVLLRRQRPGSSHTRRAGTLSTRSSSSR
jgi:hypothetical protein